MGGRGAVSRSGAVVMSEQEYLDRAGVGSVMSDYMIDKIKLRNGTSQRQRQAMEREAQKARKDYADRRAAVKAEYAEKVSRGELRPPSMVESLMRTAHGHPDNASVQSARRLLKKRGYDWRSGKKF